MKTKERLQFNENQLINLLEFEGIYITEKTIRKELNWTKNKVDTICKLLRKKKVIVMVRHKYWGLE